MNLLAFALGAGFSLAGVWLGFYLARLTPDASPGTPEMPHTYEGAILDLATYPFQTADDDE
jgi:hypothetical protein